MNINLELYRVFFIVAKNGSISNAANELCITQPAVSRLIQSLEDQLGGNLFVRTRHGVTLTEEGKVLHEYISQGLTFFQNGENKFSQLKNLEAGSIRIGSSTTVTRHVLLPYLEKFHKLYPKIDIQIINHMTLELVQMLRNGTVDMLVLNLPMKENKDIELIPIKEIQDCFVTGPDYIELANEVIDIKELNNYPLILQKMPSNTRTFLDAFLQGNNIKLIPQIEIASYNLVMDFIKIGLGIGYATKDFILDELNQNKLYEIKTTPKVPKRQIGIALMNNTIASFGVKKLIEIVLEKNTNYKLRR